MMYFYGVYIRDNGLSLLLDTIRYLAEPDALRKSHVTVRGPYKNRIDIKNMQSVNLREAQIVQPGNFFISRQKTIFLKCEIPGIYDIWYKPNYPNSFAHITIYDGNDMEFAKKIFDVIYKYKWDFSTTCSNLVELEKKTVSNPSLNILEHEFVANFRSLFDYNEDISKVQTINKNFRLLMIDKVVGIIEKYYMNNNFKKIPFKPET